MSSRGFHTLHLKIIKKITHSYKRAAVLISSDNTTPNTFTILQSVVISTSRFVPRVATLANKEECNKTMLIIR